MIHTIASVTAAMSSICIPGLRFLVRPDSFDEHRMGLVLCDAMVGQLAFRHHAARAGYAPVRAALKKD